MSDFSPEHRRRAIWSTEAAASCGVSERLTPALLWAYKSGLTDELPVEGLPVRLGLACQDGVAAIHAEDTGDSLQRLDDIELIREVNGVPLGSHFDYLNKTKALLHEVKFFGIQRLKEFGAANSDSVPMDVLVQCLHQMLVWNADDTGYGKVNGVEINVVFGNVERLTFVIPWDEEAIDKLMREEAAFWALVQSETPPPPRNLDDARRIFARADGSAVPASREALAACQALGGLKKQVKALEAQAEAVQLMVCREMGLASTLLGPDGRPVATWGASKPAERVDVKRLKVERPEIAAEFMQVGEPIRRFLLK